MTSFKPVFVQLFMWIHMSDLLFILIKLHFRLESLFPLITFFFYRTFRE